MHCIESQKKAAWRRFMIVGMGMALMAGCASSPKSEPTAPGPGAAKAAPSPNAGPRARSMKEVQWRAAQQLVAAHPNGTYLDKPPQVLLAIPVIEVELNANGSIKNTKVLRYPRQAPETTQMAIDALRRAAPFGDVSHLPKPWTFTEVFLYRDDKRFKPRTLDE